MHESSVGGISQTQEKVMFWELEQSLTGIWELGAKEIRL